MSEDIEHRIKCLLIETLELEDIEPDEIDAKEPLMGSGIDLDSIDALELVVRVEKEFGIKIKNSEEAKVALQSISTLEDYVRRNRGS